ncbi:kinase-like domain-containing protein [Rhizophagus irregularis DAOM 181602=DAOM 197198]|nr:kinase-like domain-containing protein [Rhizophagus irregularis DAOM 181602=DAOM 197198]
MKTEFSKLNISNENSNKDSNLENVSHKNCSYCNKPFTEELWCKKCDPFKMIEGWTSGNNDIDKFIKDTIYSARNAKYKHKLMFLEWVPFDRFEDVKQIGEGGFAKVYSATWINGEAEYDKQDDGSWKKQESRSMEVALKRLNGSQNMSAEYLNELKIHWKLTTAVTSGCILRFYGITKDPETEEFMMILEFAKYGNLRSFLSKICNGLRPNFGKGTPEVYKKLAYKCMNANSNQRPTAKELYDIIDFWDDSFNKDNQEKEEFGYKRKEIKAMFEEADKEIPNISTSHKKNSDAIYTSRLFSFNNLTKPVNSSIITSYLDDDENNEDNRDSQLVDLEISSSLLQSKDDINDNENSFDE